VKSTKVRIWTIKINTLAKGKRSYTVRWGVDGEQHSQTFAGRTPADKYRSDLMQAYKNGEEFEVYGKGLPESMIPKKETETWWTFVQRYLAMKWPEVAANSRESITDALATVTPALTRDEPDRPSPEVLRKALRTVGLIPDGRRPAATPEEASALAWLARASMPLSEVTSAESVREGLNALAVNLDGKKAAATTYRRKRSVFYNVLQYAVELELISFNPIDKLRVRTNRKKVVETVDRRAVANPRQVRELLTAVSYVGTRGKNGTRGERLVAFFGCLYFAALRPGEALGLREQDCYLPEEGWGQLTLEKTRTSVGKRYTDDGEVHDERGLKHRGEDEPRTVPIPPELVALLRAHLKRFGASPGGFLFRSGRGKDQGKPLSASVYVRVWQGARALALTPHQVDSMLAARPYDLRHAGVSLWLNAGVPAPDVAERAGHTVDVLLKVYAKCIDGDKAKHNERIEFALAG
jgi:integrase